MAKPTDPSFGAGFDEAVFRAVIRSTMQMGTPSAVEERATFIWETLATFANPNSAGRPFDFNQRPLTVDQHEEVQVDCTYEFVERAGHGTAIGQFENPRMKIYVMDEDFELVRGANKVRMGGNMYTINFVEPPVSLFGPTLYVIHCQADDEAS